MKFPDVLDVQLGGSGCRKSGDHVYEVSPFSDRVNYHHDRILSFRFWEFNNEVYTVVSQGLSGMGKG